MATAMSAVRMKRHSILVFTIRYSQVVLNAVTVLRCSKILQAAEIQMMVK